MARDLLYKPPVPQALPDEASESDKARKIGVKAPTGRDLGGVGDIVPKPVEKPAGLKARAPDAKDPAYKAAYFNKDSSGVREVNQNASMMQALRGSKGATDLRQVVIPASHLNIETPDPAVLNGASAMMGLDGDFELSLENLLARQNSFAHGEGVTAELLLQRIEQLEVMVEARKTAIARMGAGRSAYAAQSVTLEQAQKSGGRAVDESEDLASDGTELIERTAEQAKAMHRRIAKALGKKLPSE